MKTIRILLAAVFASAALSAPAVYVNGDGLGQALVYPYYTTQALEGNVFNTYVTIANGDFWPKALRVRVREARNGREVAGFNLFLPAYGMWAAVIAPYQDGAYIVTPDPACTDPPFQADSGSRSVVFSNAAYAANDDGFGAGRDRLKEGFVEVLEMASVSGGSLPSCDAIRAGNPGTLVAPRGGIYGMLTLINVASGMDYTENAVALADLATGSYFRPPGDPYPDFDSAEIGNVAAFMRAGKLYRVTMPTGLGAVEAALSASHVHNEVVLDSGTASSTDWILTMPTRRFHAAGRSSPWFATAMDPNGRLRMDIRVTTRDDTGALLVIGCGFLCSNGEHPNFDIEAPWSASVLTFDLKAPTGAVAATGALGSRNGWNVALPIQPGGADLVVTFNDPGYSSSRPVPVFSTTRLADGSTGTETIGFSNMGVPVVGFMARTLRNGTLDCSAGKCQGNYGGSAPHRLLRGGL